MLNGVGVLRFHEIPFNLLQCETKRAQRKVQHAVHYGIPPHGLGVLQCNQHEDDPKAARAPDLPVATPKPKIQSAVTPSQGRL